MSKQHFWTVLGRSKDDLDFSGKLLKDLEGTLQADGYDLSPGEKEIVRQVLSPNVPAFPGLEAGMPGAADAEYQRQKNRERMDAQLKRGTELGEYTVKILKDTLNHAASTYRTITLMNKVMFFTGMTLFAAAALYGAIFKDRTAYSLLLAGMGAANFVALFLLGPIEKTQIALSNLVQVEVTFMNYFEQITFWECYALQPKGFPPAPDPANIEKASLNLQLRSRETVELLQVYVENSPEKEKARLRKAAKGDANPPA